MPIRAAQAERLPSAEKIVDKLEIFAVEGKWDGLRVQIHFDKRPVPERQQLRKRCLAVAGKVLSEYFPEIWTILPICFRKSAKRWSN